jgi:hypothetical protein
MTHPPFKFRKIWQGVSNLNQDIYTYLNCCNLLIYSSYKRGPAVAQLIEVL